MKVYKRYELRAGFKKKPEGKKGAPYWHAHFIWDNYQNCFVSPFTGKPNDGIKTYCIEDSDYVKYKPTQSSTLEFVLDEMNINSQYIDQLIFHYANSPLKKENDQDLLDLISDTV